MTNATHLELEFEWLLRVLNARIAEHFQETVEEPIAEVLEMAPLLDGPSSPYSRFVNEYDLGPEERVVLLTGLAPYVQPQLLDIFSTIKRENGREITEFGGLRLSDQSLFLPTVETVLFILSGNDLERRFRYQEYFTAHHPFIHRAILNIETGGRNSQYVTTAVLRPTDEVIEQFTFGKSQPPVFGSNFPAKRLHTKMEWEDLVLEQQIVEQIEEVKSWIEHSDKIMDEWGMRNRLMPGFRSLFYGPPGTGKTLTAALLGKMTGREVYRIDLSQVVSKYIGETEKNLGRVFDRAEYKNWILFFDEADALFGKRSQIKDAHDRFANQEVSFLLQRIEDYDGIIILASNAKDNIDEAFSRRFQSVVNFPMPKAPERYHLWEKAFPDALHFEEGLSLDNLSKKFELAGGSIMNVVRYSVLMAAKEGSTTIRALHLETGIRREMRKFGRIM